MHMLKKMSEMKRLVVIWAIVSFVLIAASTIGLFFGQPGWIIGVTIGCLIELISVTLLTKGTTEILKNEKPSLFLLYFGLRMILFIGVIIFLVLMQYKFYVEAFNNSFWGALIGYTPMQIIVIIVQLKDKSGEKNG